MKDHPSRRIDPLLIGIALLSAFLNGYNIWRDPYANAYYTAAVTSMLQNFHAFFYASLDPVGFVTVDKPPVTFWIQTLFAWVFGVHGWSVVLPQALAGVGSVWLVHRLVGPTFGLAAARIAALTMALTPIAVAVSRTNNVDSMLVFTLLIGAALLLRGVRAGRVGPLLGAFAMIGIGFNEKMLEAYMALPAFVLLVLIAWRSGWKKKLSVLAAAAVLLLVVSFSWAVAVDSVPADSRPYIGSSQTNSVLELAFGYNGLSRLTGMGRDRFGRRPEAGADAGIGPGSGRPLASPDGSEDGQAAGPRDGGSGQGAPGGRNGLAGPGRTFPGPGGVRDGGAFGPGGGSGPGGGMFGTGQAGPLRLFQRELSGQASWLLPFVAFACIALLAGIRRRKPLTQAQAETLFWLGWLLPEMAFFSVAGFFHPYYLIMLAPPIAALAGAGWTALRDRFINEGNWSRWLLPFGILTTTVFEVYVLYLYRGEVGNGWYCGVGAAGIAISAALIASKREFRSVQTLAAAGLLVLLIAPAYWAATPLMHGDNGPMPEAGPAAKGGFGSGGPFPQTAVRDPGAFPQTPAAALGRGQGPGAEPGFDLRGSRIDSKLVDYLTQHAAGEPFLFATTDAMTASPYIIETGKAVMAMGGFSGGDPILNVDKIKQLVAEHQVRYFLIPSAEGGGFGIPGGQDRGLTEVLDWIRTNGTEVPATEWQSGEATTRSGRFRFGGRGNDVLFEVNGAQASR